MMTQDDFFRLVDGIMAQGYPEEVACDFAARLGDVIEEDPDGKLVVRGDDGRVLAKLDPLE